MKTKTNLALAIIIMMLFSTNLFAQRETDIEGGKNHPLISRFKGSVIEFYDHKNYDEYTSILGFDEDGKPNKQIDIEGEITRIQYSASKDHSVFEVFKNYEIALKNANFDILFSCSNKTRPSFEYWREIYYREINELKGNSIDPDGRMGYNYLLAKGNNKGKNIYVVLFVSSDNDYDWILTTLDIIEEKPMESGLVTAISIDKGMKELGHVTLAGIFFDTGKITIKAESDAALKSIAEYLNANSNSKFCIVGHTDNAGDFANNMTLSENRAKAVLNELVPKYGVNTNQLKAYGVSSLSPVFSNSSDEGRAKNRRVEIVEQ